MVIYQSEENYKGTRFEIDRNYDGQYSLRILGEHNGRKDALLTVIPIPDPEVLGRTVLSDTLGYDDWVVYQP